MLPPEPKIFHGREKELSEILQSFAGHKSPRVAILGPGGIGKSSLSRALIHHPDISARYCDNRFFVSCDSICTSTELAALVGSYLGMKAGKNVKDLVVQQLARISSCLLVLDNMETIWEETQSRAECEEFLTLLTDVDQLALVAST
ncbi:hypothetical protein C8R43DRAFT_872912 [Mycena crocata]|nr:hypothetical protein C8R43DRAFT_872912 [Mycena crocata]